MLALEWAWAEPGYVDFIDARHGDGEHVGAVLCLAAGEGLHTAGAAEHVMNDVFVEPIIADGVQAAQELELRGFDEGEPKALFGADGTVASDGLGGVGGCLEAYP